MQEIKQLIAGYQRFHERYFIKQPGLYKRLSKEGQSPEFLFIACCDSRVHPTQLMDTTPGDIFVTRNIANLVPADEADEKHYATVAAMEFAIKHLGVRHVIVMGHSQCGGIKSLMEGEHLGHDCQFIEPWMKIVGEVRETVLNEHADKTFAEQCLLCEKASIVNSLENLKTFPWIKQRIDKGKLFIHGWYFNIETGNLLIRQGDGFIPINELTISI